MYNVTVSVLAVVQLIVFAHLSFGSIYASTVMQAYASVSAGASNLMFGLSILCTAGSKGILLAAEKKHLPDWHWQNWKENLGLAFVYAMFAALFAAYLWCGFSTGFFQHLDKAWVFVVITSLSLLLLLVEAGYWTLLLVLNFGKKK